MRFALPLGAADSRAVSFMRLGGGYVKGVLHQFMFMRFRTSVHRLGSPERRGNGSGRVKVAEGIAEVLAGT